MTGEKTFYDFVKFETFAKAYKTNNFVIPANPGSVPRAGPGSESGTGPSEIHSAVLRNFTRQALESSVLTDFLDSGSVIPDIDPGPE